MDVLPGQRLLVGLTYVGPDAAPRERRQFLGDVLPPDGVAPGVLVRSPTGETLTLPAAPAAYLPAPRGSYRCLATGELFIDPDLLTSWRITLADGADPHWEANPAPLVHSSLPDEWDFTYRHDVHYLRRFLDHHAADYLGRRVLVYLQVYHDGPSGDHFVGEELHAGRLTRASYAEGAILVLDSGKEFRLPPDLALLQPAPLSLAPADYITRWTVLRPPDEDE